MYDSEDRISEKRRRLLIISSILVGVIILLLLILLAVKGGKTPEEPEKKELHCELQVAGGVQPGYDGIYRTEIEIVFKQTDLDGHREQVAKKTIGISDNSLNEDTYKIIRSGKYSVHGYLQDIDGNVGTCDLDVDVQISIPTCELEANSNEKGENGWYKQDVEVTFRDMSTNNPNSSIVKYYIEKAGVVIDASRRENNDIYQIKNNEEVDLTGYVIDSNGAAGECHISVKKDSSPPSCRLKVMSGTQNNGVYVDAPTIGFDSVNDNNPDTVTKGVGLSKNYENETYTLKENGAYNIYGYVKDEAGNETVCNISVKKDDGSGINNISEPSCLLYITANKFTLEGEHKYAMYIDEKQNRTANVYMETSANVTAYGIGIEENYNGSKKYIISQPGKYTIKGFVKNAAGETNYCVTPEFTIKGALLSDVAQPGDFVNYDVSYTQQMCSETDTSPKTGWRVLEVQNNGQVVLVSNGVTDCIYHNGSSTNTIKEMSERANFYKSNKYALSAEPLNCGSYQAGGCQYSLESSKTYTINSSYYMGTSANNQEMWLINSGGIPVKISNGKYGMRTVVVLSPYVVTPGKSNGIWLIDR
jgi:hypothetical protein